VSQDVERCSLGQTQAPAGRDTVAEVADRHCSASVVVLTGMWFAVGYRRGAKSVPVKRWPVAAQAQKEPKSSASANFATSALLRKTMKASSAYHVERSLVPV
jgi:hypothetical protein